MAVGEIITAARYNAIQAKVSQTLGVGAGRYGYGQTVTSYQVTSSNDVTAVHINYLKTDLEKLYAHQTGGVPVLTTVASTEDITDAIWAVYSTAADTAYLNHLAVFESTQTSIESKLASTPRTTVWGGNAQPQSVYHEFAITFDNANHRRHFFNAGGEVRFASTLTGGSGAKYTEWNSMLSAMGTVKFTYGNCTASSGTGFGLGNFDLTTTYTTVFIKSGSGVYAENDYIIKAKTNSNGTQVIFLIEFNDGDTGGPDIDEPVTGTLTSTISQLRATGSYVVVSSPGYANIQTLA
tara:strand:- start:64450 stop:65331 length:882 start_codon:yes stop_codon:yes gene_type:complete